MSSPLDIVARRAGAVMVDRGGVSVAAHYGSAAGELAVCIRAVGLADRSELGKLVLSGSEAGVAELVRRMTGAALAPAGVSISSEAWWCAAAPGHVIVLCDPRRRARLLAVLRIQARRLPGVEVSDCSEVYWDRPETEWPRDAEGRIEMFTKRLNLNALRAERS